MKTILARFTLIAATFTVTITTARAGWLDWLPKPSATESSAAPTAVTSLTHDEMVRGLKEALSQGVGHAVSELGKNDGFLKNLDVKIPMPESLQRVEKSLRAVGQNKLADEFVATMNHAAEKAVPEAASIFADSISKMTLEDAKSILSGPPDAATQYFRKTSDTKLQEKFLPIVKDATQKVGVAAAYKNLIQQAGPVAQFLGQDAGDLDGYITKRSLDGLFKMVAAEEKRIRENPVARTSDLLKKVFGVPIK